MAVFSRATWTLALLIAVLFLPLSAGAQTTVSNPRIVEFDPSPDHSGVQSDGRPIVQGYEMRVYQVGASQPFHRVNLGKPSVQSDGKLRYDFSAGLSAWPAPGGTYEARVVALGPGGEGVSPLSNPFTLSICGYTLSGSSALFPSAGGGGAVGVTTTTGCSWTLTESASWISPMTASGTGSGTATYSVAANTTTSSRTATLTIAGRPYSVTQEAGGSSCSYSTSPSSVSLAAAGGTASIGVTCASGCAWTAAPSASWVAVSPASGTASGTVRLTVAANTSTTGRSATVTIAGRSHSVLQSGASSTQPVLASPWTNGDIGAVGLSGSASYSSGLFTVVGAGADIWGSADSFHFVRQTLAGDGDIVARVRSVQNTHVYAKGGIMLRASLTANSPHVILDVKPNGGVEFMTRTTTGGTTSLIGTSSQAFPAWIRLARRGSTITASVSADGTTWRTVGSRSLSLPSTVYAGLAVTSHNTATRNTSTFDQVSVAAASAADASALPSPWQGQDIGVVGIAGSAGYSSGLFTVVGAGADIWGSADSFYFVRQALSGDGQVVARVRSMQNTHQYAKAGIMLRGALTANSPHVILDLKPNGGVELMARAASGGTTTVVATSSQAFPAWLRLVRRGSTITGSVSADGSTWRTIGSISVSLPSTAYAGMAVTSHNTATRNTSTFDQVSVAAASAADASALPSPWQARDIGTVGITGSTTYSSGLFSVNGAGNDIWGTADGFRYVYRPQLAVGEIVARVTAVTNTDPYAKAGVMLRDGTAANARHVTLSVKPGGGVEFLARSATGGATQYLGGVSLQVPAWLRLQRSSSSVTASYSTDGTTWRTIGTTTITTASPQMGLAVTSHDTGRLNQARFDNVTVR